MLQCLLDARRSPDSPLLAGLAMKLLRGKPLSPGRLKLDTANVASDFCASFFVGHLRGRRRRREIDKHVP